MINRLGEYPSFGLRVRNAVCFVALELGRQPRDPEGLKRAIDLTLALALLLLAAPIIGLLALMIKLADPGPAFYGQWRIGRYGRPIRVPKLRTMYRDAEQRLERLLASDPGLRKHWPRHFKLPQDPRILSRVGTMLQHCDGLNRACRHRGRHRGEPGGASAARGFRVVESGTPPRGPIDSGTDIAQVDANNGTTAGCWRSRRRLFTDVLATVVAEVRAQANSDVQRMSSIILRQARVKSSLSY